MRSIPVIMRISGFSFKSLAFAMLLLPAISYGQDTIAFPMRFGVGVSAFLPISSLTGYYPQGFEINGYYDINERFTISADGGYSTFNTENYNYVFSNSGVFFRIGTDYNMLNPVRAAGRYFAGGSVKYGLSVYDFQSQVIDYMNYWGNYTTAAAPLRKAAHYLEFSPTMTAELFKNVFVGWSIDLRVLLWSGTGEHLRAIDIPGYGNGSKPVSAGMNYYLSIRIPYKTKQVIYLKKERTVDTVDEEGK